ncbi:histidine--tRNA ligase [Hippea jasoniae]|uniref:histidine--tRNA ligase n=1 Tax=Hippea jasoniae TaxID=944479 RepID=UPI0005578A5E|nr:histidine--tRNA ligase [Hippea jasoniae]
MILKGFKDILPEDIDKWHKLEHSARKVLESFGYKEIRTPILEKTQLFARGVGEATDIVEKEMYTFEDRSKESVTLRPEGTAGVVRAFIDNNLYDTPLKRFYYIGPMFRHERPQKGRLRQFHQIGVEVFGIEKAAVDAEIVMVNIKLLSELNINDYTIEINNIGCPVCRPEFSKKLKEYFEKHYDKLCDDCKRRLYRNPLRILDCKNKNCSAIARNAPKITDSVCENCKNHYKEVKQHLDFLKIPYKENPYLVRGLDYYTKFVFEIKTDRLGAQGTISAGGRYDNLIEQLGGKPTSGIGFAAGCERLIELMPLADTKPIVFYIANLGVDSYALEILKTVSEIGATYVEFENKSLKAMMKKANKIKARFAIIVGENELKNREVVLRDLSNSTQKTLKFDNIVDEVKKWL